MFLNVHKNFNVNFSRFLKYERLLRCMAFVKRFIDTKLFLLINNDVCLTSDQLLWSKIYSLKIIQSQTYSFEISFLLKNPNRDAQPSVPEVAALPPSRLSAFTKPFSYVGVDFFGPFLVTAGRKTEKRYGAVIT